MDQRNLIWALLLPALGAGGSAYSSDLVAPFALDTAATLPAGVSNPRFINIFTSMGSRFADDGSVEGLGEPLNKLVTWKDVLDAQELPGKPDPAKRASVAGLLEKNGIGGNPGSTTGQVNTFANIKVAALAAGITDRFTIAGVLPLVKIDVSASTGFVASDEGRAFVHAAGSDSSPLSADEAASKLNDAINQKLLGLGYQPIPTSETISGVGDAQLIGKYRIQDNGVSSVSVKGTVVLPTGIAPDPDKALDIPTGDGRFGLGIAGIYDQRLKWDIRWNTYASYLARLPHQLIKRIPTSVEDPLSADKEDMHERTRHQFAFGTGLEHFFSSSGIVVGGGYSFQYQTRADYKPGTAQNADRYVLLDDLQPLQALHSVVATAGFSTIEWFKQKKFIYPFQVNVSYSHPIAGRNVTTNDLVAGELLVFF